MDESESTKTRLASLQDEFDRLTTDYAAKALHGKELESKLDSLLAEKETLTQELTAAREELDSDERNSDALTALRDQIDSLTSEKSAAQEEIQKLKAEIDSLRGEMMSGAGQKLATDMYDKWGVELQRELGALLLKRDEMSSEREVADEKIKKLSEERDKAVADLDAAKKGYAESELKWKQELAYWEKRANVTWKAARDAEARLEQVNAEANILRQKMSLTTGTNSLGGGPGGMGDFPMPPPPPPPLMGNPFGHMPSMTPSGHPGHHPGNPSPADYARSHHSSTPTSGVGGLVPPPAPPPPPPPSNAARHGALSPSSNHFFDHSGGYGSGPPSINSLSNNWDSVSASEFYDPYSGGPPSLAHQQQQQPPHPGSIPPTSSMAGPMPGPPSSTHQQYPPMMNNSWHAQQQNNNHANNSQHPQTSTSYYHQQQQYHHQQNQYPPQQQQQKQHGPPHTTAAGTENISQHNNSSINNSLHTTDSMSRSMV